MQNLNFKLGALRNEKRRYLAFYTGTSYLTSTVNSLDSLPPGLTFNGPLGGGGGGEFLPYIIFFGLPIMHFFFIFMLQQLVWFFFGIDMLSLFYIATFYRRVMKCFFLGIKHLQV